MGGERRYSDECHRSRGSNRCFGKRRAGPGRGRAELSLRGEALSPVQGPLVLQVRALLDGRYNVSFEDVRRVCLPAMRHRVLLNFEAQAEGVQTDTVLLDLLEKVPEKAETVRV